MNLIKNRKHFFLACAFLHLLVALTIGIMFLSLPRIPVTPEEVRIAVKKISEFPEGLTISQFATRLYQLGLIESLERYHFKDYVHSWKLKTTDSNSREEYYVAGDFFPNGLRFVTIATRRESRTVATIELEEKMKQNGEKPP